MTIFKSYASHYDGDRLFSQFEEYVIAEHAKHFVLALCNGFEGDLLVVLDGVSYFQVSPVVNLAIRDDLVFVTLSSCPAELNLVEGCWRQLQKVLSNRLLDSLDELTTAIDAVVDQLTALGGE